MRRRIFNVLTSILLTTATSCQIFHTTQNKTYSTISPIITETISPTSYESAERHPTMQRRVKTRSELRVGETYAVLQRRRADIPYLVEAIRVNALDVPHKDWICYENIPPEQPENIPITETARPIEYFEISPDNSSNQTAHTGFVLIALERIVGEEIYITPPQDPNSPEEQLKRLLEEK